MPVHFEAAVWTLEKDEDAADADPRCCFHGYIGVGCEEAERTDADTPFSALELKYALFQTNSLRLGCGGIGQRCSW